MTADDYNNLADEAYKEISKKMVIKIDNEVQILDSESVDIMKNKYNRF